MLLEFESKMASASSIAHQLWLMMFSLVAISSRRRSSRVPLTSSSMTARDFLYLSKSATRSRSASHRSLIGAFNSMRASSSSPSPRSRARAHNSPSSRTSPRACSFPTSLRTTCIFGARGCGGHAQCAGRSPHGTAPYTSWILNLRWALASHTAYNWSILCLLSARAAPRATRCRCGSVPPASWRPSGPARIRPNTRAVCPSRSCGTHSTFLVTYHVGLCTRRAGCRRYGYIKISWWFIGCPDIICTKVAPMLHISFAALREAFFSRSGDM